MGFFKKIKINKPKVSDYLLQLLTVIIGVFLGMLASEWSSNKSQVKKEKAILLSIRQEMVTNLEYLENRAIYQRNFFKSLDSLSKAIAHTAPIFDEPFLDEGFLDRFPNWPGLGKPKLDNAMFEAAKSSNILPELDIKLLQQLSQTYGMQTNIDEIRQVYGGQILTIRPHTTYREVKRLMWGIMQELFGSNYNLIKEYKKTIELIDQKG